MDARNSLLKFLRAIDLDPIEWDEATRLTGEGAAYIGQILDAGFSASQAAIILLSGDDVGRLGKYYLNDYDPDNDRNLTPQARLNVIFEAGMAFGRYPQRTILVQVGAVRPFTDIAGRHILRMSDSPESRNALVDILRTAGCAVKTDSRNDYLSVGRFDDSIREPDLPNGPSKPALKLETRKAIFDDAAKHKEKIWLYLRNDMTEAAEVRHPSWIPKPNGIKGTILDRTMQMNLEGEWCPQGHGLDRVHVAPGERFRLWVDPAEQSMEILRGLCESDAKIGMLNLQVNGFEVSLEV